MARCLYCGGATEARGGEDAGIDCPGCSTRMLKSDAHGVIIDECPSCHGAWYDRGELKALIAKVIEHAGEARDAEEGVARFAMTQLTAEYRSCPRCHGAMSRRNYEQISGVMIDTCPSHGTFLDAAEFDRIRAFVQSGGEALAASGRATEHARLAESEATTERILTGARAMRGGALDNWWARPYLGSGLGLLGISMTALLHHLLDD